MERPTSVKGLVDLTGACFVDFLLPCHFCSNFLTNVEKSLFDKFALRLLWKNGCAYGCCQACIRTCSFVEQQCYAEKTISRADIRNYGTNVSEVTIRCKLCLKLLDCQEKLKSLYKKQVTERRHKLRGICDLCRLDVRHL